MTTLLVANLKRRVVPLLLVVLIAVSAAQAWMTYDALRHARADRRVAQTTNEISISGGVCSNDSCAHPGRYLQIPRSASPAELNDPEFIRPYFVAAFERMARAAAAELAPLDALIMRIHTLGTLVGVAWAIIFVSLILGADWMRNVWPQQLLYTRRSSLLIAKVIAVWLLLLISVVATLLLMIVMDLIVRSIIPGHYTGVASFGSVFLALLHALLSISMYAGIAMTGTMLTRTAMGGLGLAAAYAGAESFLIRILPWSAHLLPGSYVAGNLRGAPGQLTMEPTRWWMPAGSDSDLAATILTLVWIGLAISVTRAILDRRDCHPLRT